MRVPWASIALAVAILAIYVSSSGGQLYPDAVALSQNAFGGQNLFAVFFYVGYHLGVQHLAGNLVPLVFFAVLLELVASGRHVVAVFALSGFLAALFFAVLSPGSLLAGASGGVAGLMAAGALVRPKIAVALLLVVPLLSSFVVLPALDAVTSSSFTAMAAQAESLERQADALAAEGRVQEAEAARADAERVDVALAEQQTARARESAAQPDFWVHLVGALSGAGYVALVMPERIRDGFEDFRRFLSDSLPGGNK